MKLIEAINQVDSLKPNTFSMEQKIGWLSKLDGIVKTQIIDFHEKKKYICFYGYDAKTDPNTELLVREPFDTIYLRWLEAQIDYHNGEIKRYNISIGMFNAEYEAFENYYRRNHMPKAKGRFVF